LAATHCTGCGKPLTTAGAPDGDRCGGCARPIDPPHYCPVCGGWLAVTVNPTGWKARCREHGEIRPGDR
jgi:primosomal protein N'